MSHTSADVLRYFFEISSRKLVGVCLRTNALARESPPEYGVRSSSSGVEALRETARSPGGSVLPFAFAKRRSVSLASSKRPTLTEYNKLSGASMMQTMSANNGVVESNNSKRQDP